MAGAAFVTRLKRPFLRIRRRRSLKVGSNENQLQESSGGGIERSTPPKHGGESDNCSLKQSQGAAEAAKPSGESLAECKRRSSDLCKPRRRRRTFDGGTHLTKDRICQDVSVETLFRETEAEPSCKVYCASPILRSLSKVFGKKRIEAGGERSVRISCIQGMHWSANLQNYRPSGYKLFAKRNRSLTESSKKDVTELLQDSTSKGSDILKKSPRRTPGREPASDETSPVLLARSEDASPYGLDDTSDGRMDTADATTAVISTRASSMPISGKQARCLNREEEGDDDDEELGMEEDDSYLRTYPGVFQPPAVVFGLRRRYTLAPSRFQREHLERLRNATKVSPSRNSSKDS